MKKTRKMGNFDLRLKFENEKVFDSTLKNINEVEDVFKTLKKKFK